MIFNKPVCHRQLLISSKRSELPFEAWCAKLYDRAVLSDCTHLQSATVIKQDKKQLYETELVSESWISKHVMSMKTVDSAKGSSRLRRKFRKATQQDQAQFTSISKDEVALWHSDSLQTLSTFKIQSAFQLMNKDETAIALSNNCKCTFGVQKVKLLVKGKFCCCMMTWYVVKMD